MCHVLLHRRATRADRRYLILAEHVCRRAKLQNLLASIVLGWRALPLAQLDLNSTIERLTFRRAVVGDEIAYSTIEQANPFRVYI